MENEQYDKLCEAAKSLVWALNDNIQDANELREGLQETPMRLVRAWRFFTSGYAVDIAKLLKTFKDGAENYE